MIEGRGCFKIYVSSESEACPDGLRLLGLIITGWSCSCSCSRLSELLLKLRPAGDTCGGIMVLDFCSFPAEENN